MTLLAQVEACLNSRPLQALTDDPKDISALTPGHFLIGMPIIAVPEPSHEERSTSAMSRWLLLQKMRDHFWARWSQEYLRGLAPRNKWKQGVIDISVGRLCILKNEIPPPPPNKKATGQNHRSTPWRRWMYSCSYHQDGDDGTKAARGKAHTPTR